MINLLSLLMKILENSDISTLRAKFRTFLLLVATLDRKYECEMTPFHWPTLRWLSKDVDGRILIIFLLWSQIQLSVHGIGQW